MDWQEYRIEAKRVVDFIADYMQNIREYRVFPAVVPGYMRELLPDQPPIKGESWEVIMNDIQKHIVPGITHWQSPYMHAYFPALNSPASLMGDMIADAFNCIGFTWASSPACTELEVVVMDWLAKAINLPPCFMNKESNGRGGGVLQTTASVFGKKIGINRDQAHSSVEKASLIGLVKIRYIESDENYSMRVDHLEKCIIQDKQLNLTPFYICATLGTTGCCAFDNLRAICEVAKKFNCYVHVDAAYAGSAFILKEYRHLMDGVELVDSLAFNPSKWLMIHFDCTAMWLQNVSTLHRTFNVNPLYLKHEQTGFAIDYMHWQIPLSRRFRSLKLWCVLRNFGLKGLQDHIRRGIKLAIYFENLVKQDCRFEICAPRILGLVVFRLKSGNELTECLLKKLNSQGKIHCVPASLKGTYVIRFTVTSTRTNTQDIDRDWFVIQQMATKILIEEQASEPNLPVETVVNPQAQPAKANPTKTPKLQQLAANFGTSLLLCNSPMTPKLVNGSFAAIMDNQDVVKEFVNKFSLNNLSWQRNNTALRRRIKGLMLSDKQFSLDSRMDCIMATVNIDDNESSKLNRNNTGSIKEKRSRKQTRLQQIIDPNEEDKSSENSIQEEDE